MSQELTQRVLRVIATSKRIPLEQVTIESEFQQLNIDSMDAVEILFALENEFDINIPDDEVREVRNVRQMVEGVARLVAAKAGAVHRTGAAAGPGSHWPARRRAAQLVSRAVRRTLVRSGHGSGAHAAHGRNVERNRL